jgi:hypothetical protein
MRIEAGGREAADAFTLQLTLALQQQERRAEVRLRPVHGPAPLLPREAGEQSP